MRSGILLAIVILIFSAALFISCEAILRRRLNQQFFHSVVEAYRLIAHTLRLNERAAFLKLTKILEYFANVLGEPARHDPHDPFWLT